MRKLKKTNLPNPENFDRSIYDDETIEDLTAYIQWHRKHPHTSSPRLKDERGNLSKEPPPMTEWREDNAMLAIPSRNAIELEKKPLSSYGSSFYLEKFGINASFDEVSVMTISERLPFKAENASANKLEAENVNNEWGHTSVREEYSLSHIPLSARSKSLIDFNEDIEKDFISKTNKGYKFETQKIEGELNARKKEVSQNKVIYQKLVSLALNTKVCDPDRKKISPWVDPFPDTFFTKNGTYLDDFKSEELEQKIQVH
jgi:hypothetical protein